MKSFIKNKAELPKKAFRAFLAGLMAALPLALTILILLWMVNFVQNFIGPQSFFGRILGSIGLKFVTSSAAAYLLGTGGRCYLVYLAERLAELLDLLRQAGLEPKRLRCIHSRAGQAARMVLVESRRGGGVGLTVEAPLYVYDGEHYSAEVLRCYSGGVS